MKLIEFLGNNQIPLALTCIILHIAVMTEYTVLRTDPHYIYNILIEYNMCMLIIKLYIKSEHILLLVIVGKNNARIVCSLI